MINSASVSGRAKRALTVRCDASGILEWRCAYRGCKKRIYSLYKRQLEANVRAHLKTHEREIAKSALKKVKKVRRRGRGF